MLELNRLPVALVKLDGCVLIGLANDLGRLKTPREAGGRAFAPLPNCPGKPVLRRE